MSRRYIDIIYEDRDLIVVNKPRGVEVARNPNPHIPPLVKGGKGGLSNALVDDVRAYLLRKYPGARGVFVRPLHRLDKETTGLVLFAKSNAGMELVEGIKSHRVKRVYTAAVEGAVDQEDGTIGLPLEKGDFGHGKKVGVVARGEGKKAVTHYHVVERYENASLLMVWLETGFTHQIRVHLASIGHPIVGDKVYNPHGSTKFPRQALHAAKVVFHHPATGKQIELKAPIPKDMDELIDRLRG